MIKIKKIIFFTIKSVLTLVALLTLVLFFYAAFFFEQSVVERKTEENQITKIALNPSSITVVLFVEYKLAYFKVRSSPKRDLLTLYRA